MLTLAHIAQKYGPEMAVLVGCCRVHLGTATIDEVARWSADPALDWRAVFQRSAQHRIRPIVYRVLVQTPVPDAIRRRLKAELTAHLQQVVEMAREVERILARFAGAGIPALPYKGVAYAVQAYGDLALRERGDLDLVIHEADLEAAMAIMREDGFSDPQFPLYQRMGSATWRRNTKDYCFDKALPGQRGLHVELHYRIIGAGYYFPLEHNSFRREGAQEQVLLSRPVQLLPMEEHVRAITMHHLLHDRLGYLRTALDLAVGFRATGRTEATHPAPGFLDERPLLHVLHVLLGVEAPQPPDVAKRAERLVEEILSSGYKKVWQVKVPIWDSARHYGHGLAQKSVFYHKWTDKVRAVLKIYSKLVSPQPIDMEFVRLPNWLYPAYFLVRPYRLLFHPDDPIARKRAKRHPAP